MTKRKVILLVSCALLLCIYIVQLSFEAGRGTKTVKLDSKSEIDTITINNVAGEVVLSKEGDGWVVSAAKYPAAEAAADNMLSAIKEISILEKVGKRSASSDERYEIGGGKEITVTASGGGKTLRTITVGKAASTSSASYIALDGGNDICLVSGNLRGTFGKTVSDLRSRLIYKLDADKLKKVSITYDGNTLVYEKAADSPEWKAADGTPECDSEKVSSWCSSLYSASASSWADDSTALPPAPDVSARVESEGDFATLDIYKVGEDITDEDGNETSKAKYYCTSSATPYKAELSSYTAQKYMKSAADFAK